MTLNASQPLQIEIIKIVIDELMAGYIGRVE